MNVDLSTEEFLLVIEHLETISNFLNILSTLMVFALFVFVIKTLYWLFGRVFFGGI